MLARSKPVYRAYAHVDSVQNWRYLDLLYSDGSLWGVLAVRRTGQLQVYSSVSTPESQYVYVPGAEQVADIDHMVTNATTEDEDDTDA